MLEGRRERIYSRKMLEERRERIQKKFKRRRESIEKNVARKERRDSEKCQKEGEKCFGKMLE